MCAATYVAIRNPIFVIFLFCFEYLRHIDCLFLLVIDVCHLVMTFDQRTHNGIHQLQQQQQHKRQDFQKLQFKLYRYKSNVQRYQRRRHRAQWRAVASDSNPKHDLNYFINKKPIIINEKNTRTSDFHKSFCSMRQIASICAETHRDISERRNYIEATNQTNFFSKMHDCETRGLEPETRAIADVSVAWSQPQCSTRAYRQSIYICLFFKI